MTWEEYNIARRTREALLRNKSRIKCKVCKSYLCICQLGLKGFGFDVVSPVRGLSLNQKIANCPHNCVNSPKGCLDCYNWDKFEMKVAL